MNVRPAGNEEQWSIKTTVTSLEPPTVASSSREGSGSPNATLRASFSWRPLPRKRRQACSRWSHDRLLLFYWWRPKASIDYTDFSTDDGRRPLLTTDTSTDDDRRPLLTTWTITDDGRRPLLTTWTIKGLIWWRPEACIDRYRTHLMTAGGLYWPHLTTSDHIWPHKWPHLTVHDRTSMAEVVRLKPCDASLAVLKRRTA